MSAVELSQIIVENGITTRTEVLAFADEQSGEGKTDIAEFVVNRGSRVVAEVLQTAWEINSAKENLECSRKKTLDLLQAASAGECLTAIAFGISVLIRYYKEKVFKGQRLQKR